MNTAKLRSTGTRGGAGTPCSGVGRVGKGSMCRRGFAVATAMCMIALVAVAMTAVCALLTADVRRTINGAADAQLRQLLIAAEVDAPAHLSDAAQRQWTTPLPPSLMEARVASSRLEAPGAVLATAAIPGRTMTEELRFEPSGKVWVLVRAELSPGTKPR
jgi:hypothetical protein